MAHICFPSVVNKGYAPEGYSLCSVCVLENAMKEYNPTDLNKAVRRQVATWFPDEKENILQKWELKRTFLVSSILFPDDLEVSFVVSLTR